MEKSKRLHYSTFVPPGTFGALKSAGVAQGITGVGTAGAAVLASFPPGSLAVAAVRGLPSIEPVMHEKWLRLPMVLPVEVKAEIDAAAATSGLQKMFVGGVVLVASAHEFEQRIAASRGGNEGREEEGHGSEAEG